MKKYFESMEKELTPERLLGIMATVGWYANLYSADITNIIKIMDHKYD